MSFLFSNLIEIKQILEIDPSNPTYDVQLGIYNEWCAGILEELLDRPIGYQTRTTVYPGTGNQKLNLKHRPVYPTAPPAKAASLPFTAMQVIVDEGASWGEASGAFTGTPLTYGTDYAIRIDQDDGGSREAILYRLNDLWPRPIERMAGELSSFVGPDMGSIQVTYTAGYTVDTLPATLRAGAMMLITRIYNLFPLGQQLTSESYVERSIGLSENQKRYLMGMVRPFVLWHKNWTW